MKKVKVVILVLSLVLLKAELISDYRVQNNRLCSAIRQVLFELTNGTNDTKDTTCNMYIKITASSSISSLLILLVLLVLKNLWIYWFYLYS